jgi:hypothetical protein
VANEAPDPAGPAPSAAPDAARQPQRVLRAVLPLAGCVLVLLLLGAVARWQWQAYEQGRSTADADVAAYRDTSWDVLVPRNWDPMKRLRARIAQQPVDGTDAAMALEREMREAWDTAPTNAALDGAKVRLVGYLVPLEANQGAMREFLLVPYFGACIHSPPPPANQIVHVSLAQPVDSLRTMDAVSVVGTLRTSRNDSVMGMSGYALQALHVEKPPAALRLQSR